MRLFFILSFVVCSFVTHAGEITVGAAQLDRYLPQLEGKRVGLLVNQTSRIGERHLVDVLIEKGVNIKTIFAPEHGFRGDHDAGAKVANGVDKKTGLPLISLYGKNKKPGPEVMASLDVVVFDIQDVGARFYTYISSMHLMMEAAAESGGEFIVLDRPNPNGAYVDGPVLEPDFRSFVGMDTIPLLHGMTVGELAQMIAGEGWLKSDKPLALSVVPVENYRREMRYSLPVKPSPNLPNDSAVRLYPSLCFFEATPISIGRGTEFPFQVFGHDKVKLGAFSFTPQSIAGAASNPKLKGETAFGQDLRTSSIKGLDLGPFIAAYGEFKRAGLAFFKFPKFMDKLAGTDKLRKAIEAGNSEAQIRAGWQQALQRFRERRKAYLLYPDF